MLQLSEDLDYNEIKRIIMEKYKDVKLELISDYFYCILFYKVDTEVGG